MYTNKETILEAINNNPSNTYKNVLFSQNSKHKKDNIFAFSIPAGANICKFAGECAKFCYAKKGTFNYPNVKSKYSYNLELSKSDTFVNEIQLSLNALRNVTFIRIHVSGDFYNTTYIKKWVEIALNNPTKVFYAYTKAMILFKHITLPANFVLIQSEGTINDKKYLNYDKTFARVFKSEKNLKNAIDSGNFLDASDSDLQALKGAILNKNVALIIH